MPYNDESLNITGRIFDIQRFSVHDGPGIRTIVFFKGCPLHCKWCCNPESQHGGFESFVRADGEVTTVGRDVTVREVMTTVVNDESYYRRSGGGITLSGGEFLLQPDFAEALLKTAHRHGINTAVETTSFADFGVISRLLPHIDHYLCDIKHMNSEKHREYCDQPNTLILENIKRVAEIKKDVVIRVPVIPKFNDNENDIADIARFALSIGVKKLHLLPYHRLGQDKYTWLGREYQLTDIVPPSEQTMRRLLAVASATGIECQIGG